MKIVVTGSNGFIGKNLCATLREYDHYEVHEVHRDTSEKDLQAYLSSADFLFHLAGINRPQDISEFATGNVDLTKLIVETLRKFNRNIPIVLSSSTQVEQDNPYGKSKLAAEEVIQNYSASTGALHYIYRLPNVFGKWCKPNYNSFIATFCNNIMKGSEISINNPRTPVSLVYIDDVCASLLELLEGNVKPGFNKVPVEFNTTVGEVADIIRSFKASRATLITEPVGTGLTRALYATYLSYTDPENFSYRLVSHTDERGVFCEMLKTHNSGQFSFFTAHPGVTRGGHYHHTKAEKFLVIKGEARFGFRHILTGERYSITTSGDYPEIVDTVPGWSHDISNMGSDDLVVMLWANEIFNPEKPDTKVAIV
jgi:UDP-2-acetamido-2,6-beta-L-arabino-hexul-4-ose reductase